MKIRAAILDFDGTIVTADFADLLCDLVGKKAESARLNQLFHEGKIGGLDGLIQRINFLHGISLDQIREVVQPNYYFREGAEELFEYFQSQGIKTIIASGSIIALLQIFQEKLGADYLVGSRPHIKDGRLDGISLSDYSGLDFKVRDSKEILLGLGILHDAVVAIGDSPADKGIFGLARVAIAVNPKGGVEQFADHIVKSNLLDIIPILEREA